MKNLPEVVPLQYDQEELDYVNNDILLLRQMKEQFDRPYAELDGMNRAQYYEANRKADLSYIPPKSTKTDVRVVTGTTREKDTTLLSTLLNMNVEPDVTAFDTDDLMVAELGDDMTDMVKKTREIEDWHKKRPIIYREFIAQGDVFLLEQFTKDYQEVPLEKLKWDPIRDGVHKLSFKKRLELINAQCATKMIKGTHVYLGDMHTEYIEDQDAVALCMIVPRAIAQGRYGQWERWKNVPHTITHTGEFEYQQGIYNQHWAMFQTQPAFVSEVILFQKSGNRYQHYVNGIPMLPCNYPLTAIEPSGQIPMIQGKFEPISHFAISKSQPSKTKVDQAIIDEVTKLFVEGFRQKRKPPMGVKGDKVYSADIFEAGKMTPEVTDNTFFSILPPEAYRTDGSDFSFYEMIKSNINEKTTNEVYSGNGQDEVDTLGQAQIMKEQQMLRLGAALDGVVNMERRMAWCRINNIVANYTQPIGTERKEVENTVEYVKQYRKLSVKTTLEDGQPGMKVFRLTEEAFPDVTAIEKEEQELEERQGMPVRIVYLNPQMLRSLKFIWFILINPTPKSNDKLSQLMFVQNVTQAMNIFGPDALNMEYLKQRFAILINEDYTRFFKKMDIMQMFEMGLDAEEASGGAAPPTRTNTRTQNTATRPLEVAVR